MKVDHIKQHGGGYFKAEIDGSEAGMMSYSDAGGDKFVIDHTEVRPKYSGRGVGTEMVKASADYARANNLKIIPVCPFAKAVFMKNGDMRDVLYS